MKSNKILRVCELPEDLASQQHFIDRAEEDLFCAMYLYRRGICGIVPYVVICFLLHQATEKWLKAFLPVARLPTKKIHELSYLFDQAAMEEPEFLEVKAELDKVERQILEQRFPSDLRYEDTRENVEDCINTLLQAAFRTRRLVKRWIKRSEED